MSVDGGSVIAGIKIIPSVIQFNDAISNKTYKQTLTLQNVSGLSKSLRFSGPETEVKPIIPTVYVVEHRIDIM